MRWSLRAKLAASHSLPILLLMSVLSLYLLYSLEGFLTQRLVRQLSYQAQLVLDQIEQIPEVAENPQAAQSFLADVARMTDARVLVLSKERVILASTRVEDAELIGTRYTDQGIEQALHGMKGEGIGPGLTAQVAYVDLPLQREGAIAGVLRLSYEVDDLRTQFNRLHWLILGGIILTAILGLALALGLATTITRPVHQLSESAQKIADGNYQTRVSVHSRDEVAALARNFNQMAARLEEAEEARERQLAAIVHELARPLAGMQAAVETLRDGADADRETRDALLGGIEEEFARLNRMIGTLQGLHKRALRPMQLTRTEIPLDRAIRASVANFELVTAPLGIALALELPSSLPKVLADEDRLIQVLTNLLDNASKFTPHGGKITVQAGEEKNAVWVTVSDTGAGIAPDDLPYIFQQFYSGGESPEKRGMGLGLAICREIITAHGGQIRAESEPGQGARFTFSLPIG